FAAPPHLPPLPSFPTRRSSDLRYTRLLLPNWKSRGITEVEAQQRLKNPAYFAAAMVRAGDADGFVGGAATTTAETVRAAIHCIGDRKSTRLNSSHQIISYAVFC